MFMNLLFVCTGNSCRSQMAEGFARQKGHNFWQVKSAGISPKSIHPLAIAVMQEKDIDISKQESTLLTPVLLQWADIVITLCSEAEEQCPYISADKQKKHWALDDPAKAIGDEAEIMTKFRLIRDSIEEHVDSLLAELKNRMDPQERIDNKSRF